MAKRRRTKVLELSWYGDDFLRIIDERGQEALQAAAEYVLAEALRRVPRKSGDLAASAYWATSKKSTWRKLQFGQKKAKRVPNDSTIVFGFAARHSHLVEKKVKRHPIVPRRSRGPGKALNVYSFGKIRASAQHPGNKPQKFFGPAVEASREGMVAAIAKKLSINLEREMPEAPR
jgi:hypothetical protein